MAIELAGAIRLVQTCINFGQIEEMKVNKEELVKNACGNLGRLKASVSKAEKTLNIALAVIERLPEDFTERMFIGYDNSCIYTDMPWDPEKIEEAKILVSQLSDLGFGNIHINDDKGNGTLTISAHSCTNDYMFTLGITFNPNLLGSTCVLVPMKKELVERVLLWDRVCPEGYNESMEE
jgi:hypothetical protein